MPNIIRILPVITVGFLVTLVFATGALAYERISLKEAQKARSELGLVIGKPRVILNTTKDICLKGPVWKCHGQLRGGTKISLVPRQGGFQISMEIKYVRLQDLPAWQNRPIIYVDLISGKTILKRVEMFALWNDCRAGLGRDKFFAAYIRDPKLEVLKLISSVSIGNTPGEWSKC